MQGPDTETGFRTNILPGREQGEPALETGSQTQLGVLKAKSSSSAWSLFKKGRDGSIWPGTFQLWPSGSSYCLWYFSSGFLSFA